MADGLVLYTVVRSQTVEVLFADIRPMDAVAFHHGVSGTEDP
ncbi:hypothetical protein [Arthrobacter sp.]|nr:hypothetical protein [Arthrobacter sp.]